MKTDKLKLNIIFAATSSFALPILEDIYQNPFCEIQLVLTAPEKEAGRGLKKVENEIKIFAKKHKILIYQPPTLKTSEAYEFLKDNLYEGVNVFFTAAYGLYIPANVRSLYDFALNVHPSALPKYRGASPIQSVLLNGDKKSAVTIMELADGFDNGDILKQEMVDIASDDNFFSLKEKLAKVAASLSSSILFDIYNEKKLEHQIQDDREATFCQKISKEEYAIDFSKEEAAAIHNKIRAFYPNAFSVFKDTRIKILVSEIRSEETNNLEPGTIVDCSKLGVDVATKKGIIRLTKIQFPGKKPISALDIFNAKRDFFRGHF